MPPGIIGLATEPGKKHSLNKPENRERYRSMEEILYRSAYVCVFVQTLLQVLVLTVGWRVWVLSVAGSRALRGIRAGHWAALLRQKPSTRTRLPGHKTPIIRNRKGHGQQRVFTKSTCQH